MKKYLLLSLLILFNSAHSASWKDEWERYKKTHTAMFMGSTRGIPIGVFPFLLIVLGAGYAGWKFAEGDDLKTARPAGSAVQDFVKRTLAQVGYTPAQINKLKITNNRRLRDKAIVLTIDDKALVEALKLKEAGPEYKVLDQELYNQMKRWYPQLPKEDLLLILASREAVLTSDSIALLQWNIIRQAAVAFRASRIKEVLNDALTIALGAYLASYLNINKASFFSWHSIPALLPASSLFILDSAISRAYIKSVELAVMRKSVALDSNIVETYIKLLKSYDELDKHRSFMGNAILSVMCKLGGLKNYTAWFEKEYAFQKKALED